MNPFPIIITGINSLLAEHLVEQLSHSYKNIIGVYHRNKNLNIKIPQIPLSQALTFKNKVSILICLHAQIPYGSLSNTSKEMEWVNGYSINDLIQSMKPNEVIYSSTVSVYKPSLNLNEFSKIEPQNEYARTKRIGELESKKCAVYKILRFPSLFGPKMTQETFIPSIIKNAISKKTINLFGDGSRMQNYLSYEGAANYIVKAMNARAGTYLCTAEKSYSNKAIALHVSKKLNGIKIHYSGKDTSPSSTYNNSITKKEFNITEYEDTLLKIEDLISWKIGQS